MRGLIAVGALLLTGCNSATSDDEYERGYDDATEEARLRIAELVEENERLTETLEEAQWSIQLARDATESARSAADQAATGEWVEREYAAEEAGSYSDEASDYLDAAELSLDY